MRIVELIYRERIIPALTSQSKAKVIEELAQHLASVEPALEASELSRILADRESLASTAIGDGVAIPHGKTAGVDDIIACLGRSKRGVDFDSTDGRPTHLFFVLIAPENSAGRHLKALARISRVFKDPSFRELLLAADSADAMYEALEVEDSKY